MLAQHLTLKSGADDQQVMTVPFLSIDRLGLHRPEAKAESRGAESAHLMTSSQPF